VARLQSSQEAESFILRNYNQKRKKKKNLLPLKSNPNMKENRFKREKEAECWILCSRIAENKQKEGKNKTLEEADKEFRQKPGLIFQASKNQEIPKVDRNRFEYITKNFSKEMNYNLIRWLEFRGNIWTIQNFDILRFTQSFETIKIDHQPHVQCRDPDYGPYVRYNIKIMRKVRDISKLIREESKGVSLFREVTTLLYIAFALPCGLKEKIVEPLYKELK
jgi:hypothetical protein